MASRRSSKARKKAVILEKEVQFSLTTNATLLRPEVIEWLVDNEVGVTIYGGEGDDVIFGSQAGDHLAGGSGD